MNVRDRIEIGFEHWGRWVYRRARLVLLVSLLLVAALLSQLPNVRLETRTEHFLRPDDPHRILYDDFRARFGRDERVLIALEPPEIFDLSFLEKLRALHEDLENEVPLVVEVTSLVNARNTRGEGDELIVEDLLEEWPETEADLAALRQRVMSNPLYEDQLVSVDGTLTMVSIETEAYTQIGYEEDALAGFDGEAEEASLADRPFLTGPENRAIVDAVLEIAERHSTPDFPISVAGTPVMTEHLQGQMTVDMRRFTVLSIATIAIFLAVLFRRVAGVVLPLVVVILTVASTIAIMATVGIPIMLPTQTIPSFLLAVGVGASVHVFAIFYQRRRAGADKCDAIAFALGHSGLAVAMTSFTTAGGLVSFAAADLTPIAHYGIVGPIGIMLSLVYTVVLLPALIAVFPMRDERLLREDERPVSQRILVGLGLFATRNATAVAVVCAVLIGGGLFGASRIHFGHHMMEWFPEDDPLRMANDLMNERLGGTMFLELSLETGTENALHDPEVLNRLEALQASAEDTEIGDVWIGKTVSIVDVLKEIHQALNENRSEYYVVPQDRQLVAQELLLFENSGSDDLEDVVDSQFSLGRVTMKAPFTNAYEYRPLIQQLEADFAEILGPEIEFEITGMMGLMGRTINAVMLSMAKSYVIALAIITPLMILLIGRLRIGLVSMVPNLAPIILTLGIMGFVGVELDIFTLMIGSISIGIAVDDTIHFMHNFRRYFARSGDVEQAVRETLLTTGQAMLFTTLVLSTGFFIFMFASMDNLFRFGLLTGSTIIFAFLADVLLAPALMALVARPRKEPALGTATMEASR